MNFDTQRIKVLNYQPCFVAVSGHNRNVGMSACEDGETPVVEYFSFEDIEYINSRSPVFRTGLLEFEDAVKDEIYKALNIQPEKCVYERDIDAMLLNPTMGGMKKIVAVTDAQTIERIRGHVAKNYSILTQNVIMVVEQRAREIANGVRNSAIVIESVKHNQMEDKHVTELTNQVEALTAMVQNLLANKGATDEQPEKEVETVAVAEEPAKEEKPVKRGRPAKK